MSKLHIKTGDTVVLLTGDKKDRQKTGNQIQSGRLRRIHNTITEGMMNFGS